MEPGGTAVSPLNIPAWRDFPLRSRLEQLPGVAATPVLIDNDAKALTLAEAWAGAGRGVPNFLAMVVSTGVGGGIVLDGRLLEGRTGNAGHIGHVMVVPSGRPCLCGSRGCLEAETSGTRHRGDDGTAGRRGGAGDRRARRCTRRSRRGFGGEPARSSAGPCRWLGRARLRSGLLRGGAKRARRHAPASHTHEVARCNRSPSGPAGRWWERRPSDGGVWAVLSTVA